VSRGQLRWYDGFCIFARNNLAPYGKPKLRLAFIKPRSAQSAMIRRIQWLRDFTHREFVPEDSEAGGRELIREPPKTVRIRTFTQLFQKDQISEAMIGSDRLLVDGHFDISRQAKVGQDFVFLD
jgi:hypothetical protein